MKISSILTSCKPSNRKRVGRGIGSGMGKTCCRGVKGQKSRSGVSLAFSEGGQQSFFRSLPKRGFKNPSKLKYSLVSIADLSSKIKEKNLDASSAMTKDEMKKLGIIKSKKKKVMVKLLDSDCEFPFGVCNFQFDKVSSCAKSKIRS